MLKSMFENGLSVCLFKGRITTLPHDLNQYLQSSIGLVIRYEAIEWTSYYYDEFQCASWTSSSFMSSTKDFKEKRCHNG